MQRCINTIVTMVALVLVLVGGTTSARGQAEQCYWCPDGVPLMEQTRWYCIDGVVETLRVEYCLYYNACPTVVQDVCGAGPLPYNASLSIRRVFAPFAIGNPGLATAVIEAMKRDIGWCCGNMLNKQPCPGDNPNVMYYRIKFPTCFGINAGGWIQPCEGTPCCELSVKYEKPGGGGPCTTTLMGACTPLMGCPAPCIDNNIPMIPVPITPCDIQGNCIPCP